MSRTQAESCGVLLDLKINSKGLHERSHPKVLRSVPDLCPKEETLLRDKPDSSCCSTPRRIQRATTEHRNQRVSSDGLFLRTKSRLDPIACVSHPPKRWQKLFQNTRFFTSCCVSIRRHEPRARMTVETERCEMPEPEWSLLLKWGDPRRLARRYSFDRTQCHSPADYRGALSRPRY